ncbi:D-alanine--D-alanine ligase [Kiritimatiellota bacterium B12222]|nr:D-alanine--D-alanine ligase [Kiritimatiellota bacterium B12222]
MIESVFHKIAILKGGSGSERDVSLKSAAAVATALRTQGLEVEEVDVRTLNFTVPEGVEAVFPVIHGEMGEDGIVQRRLEELGFPYVGSRSWEMPRSFDKEVTHALLQTVDVPMAPWEMVEPGQTVSLSAPVVLKAPRQGSSIGLEIATQHRDIADALESVRKFDRRILAESFIEGTECTVGIVGEDVLPVVQINPHSGTYDYEAKYQRNDTQYLVPAPYSDELTNLLQSLALKAYHILGGRHLGRVDFRVDQKGSPFVLEMNPLPGFTATSLLPKAAAACGIDFQTLCVRILNQAEVV